MCSRGDGPQVSPADAALAEIERGIDGLRGCASAGLPEGSTRVLLRSACTLRAGQRRHDLQPPVGLPLQPVAGCLISATWPTPLARCASSVLAGRLGGGDEAYPLTMVVRGGCAHDCPDTCAWEVTVEDGRAVKLAGAAGHPYTRGGLCAKVNHYLDRVYSPERVLHPLRRVGPKGEAVFERVSWDDAVADIAERLRRILATDGGEAVLPYSYAGNMGLVQFASMDRRFFARLGASRLARTICGETANAGVTTAIGTSAACLPEDIEHARFIVLWG